MNERKLQFALTIVRVTLGLTFFLHGMQKVFGAFGGTGLNAFADYMAGVTSVMPKLTAYAVAFGELLAGTALILGCFHRLAASVLAIIMVGAIYSVTGHNGFFITRTSTGFEYNLALLAMSLAILVGGPGAWAYKIEFKKNDGR